MVDIPPEIWLNIARFLSNEELMRCLSVNALFFNLAMDLKYKEIWLRTHWTADCTRMLRKLSHPFIAGRVQRLSLFIQSAEDVISPGVGQSNSWTRLHRYLKRIIRPSKLLGSRTRPRPSQIGNTNFADATSRFVKCAPNLSTIRDFGICAVFTPNSYDFGPIFTSIQTTFGAQLYILTLSGSGELYHALLESGPSFPQLKELRLDFYISLRDPPRPLTGDQVASLVNRLCLHLEVLVICSSTAEVSSVFTQLSPLPSLVLLDIDMALHNLQDTLGLQKFLLQASYTLQTLNITGITSDTTSDSYWSSWFSNCRANPKFFSELRTVNIDPTMLGTNISVLTDFIRHVSRTLQEFNLHQWPLSTFDANLVICALSQCTKLTALKLSLLTLTITEFDQLADALPNLQSLGLRVGNMLNHTQALESSSVFLQTLKDRSYADWKLEDLSIWQACCSVRGAEHNIMIAFSQSIPSLRSFFNAGHMDPPPSGY
ncbi:hypothetical protein GALMADRAFT_210802 [Galerina marginata CBS 339.88]|uniref:F-box domain-containing protein n=1 Tax=Galerina marginata (strain CBS 339.88) TaxID=685588 RepID=A0A067T1C2_GALM3|nr:hypothetical protein GALMADRAFT_210802 [Galerina marginata CBS 339.88]